VPNKEPLTSYKVPMNEFDVVLVDHHGHFPHLKPHIFAEIHEVNLVEMKGNQVLHNGEPRIFIQTIRGWTGYLDKNLLYPDHTPRWSISRTDVIGVCCPQCWQAGRYTKVEDNLLKGLVVDNDIYRICERCGYYKRTR
jgi:hypothetical protein